MSSCHACPSRPLILNHFFVVVVVCLLIFFDDYNLMIIIAPIMIRFDYHLGARTYVEENYIKDDIDMTRLFNLISGPSIASALRRRQNLRGSS